MNDETFNMSVRKFLKTVGVTAQREIERAVLDAIKSGRLAGSETMQAEAKIVLPGAGLEVVVEGKIALE